MGDHADDALNEIFDYDDLWSRDVQDEDADDLRPHNPFSGMRGGLSRNFNRPMLPSGPGPCPRCGAPTAERRNTKTQQLFYGCLRYPRCHGSRNHDPPPE
jgi:hypothetical protein